LCKTFKWIAKIHKKDHHDESEKEPINSSTQGGLSNPQQKSMKKNMNDLSLSICALIQVLGW
jgi:hypothetical protein